MDCFPPNFGNVRSRCPPTENYGRPGVKRRFLSMKAISLAMVLMLGMALACFAEDAPARAELEGVIQRLPPDQLFGAWIVSDRVVVVTDGVTIEEDDGPIRVGAKVEVEGFLQADGSILARKIETDD
jgi:hypothetical protein